MKVCSAVRELRVAQHHKGRGVGMLGTRSLATFLVGEGMRDLRQLRNAERAQVTSSRISRDLRAISAAISHRLVSLAGGA